MLALLSVVAMEVLDADDTLILKPQRIEIRKKRVRITTLVGIFCAKHTLLGVHFAIMWLTGLLKSPCLTLD